MRVLHGRAIVEDGTLPDLEGRGLVIDVGAGDGRFVYERARVDSSAFYVGLEPAYAVSGLRINEAQELSTDEALAIPSTWGRRLLHARLRRVFSIAGERL